MNAHEEPRGTTFLTRKEPVSETINRVAKALGLGPDELRTMGLRELAQKLIEHGEKG